MGQFNNVLLAISKVHTVSQKAKESGSNIQDDVVKEVL